MKKIYRFDKKKNDLTDSYFFHKAKLDLCSGILSIRYDSSSQVSYQTMKNDVTQRCFIT